MHLLSYRLNKAVCIAVPLPSRTNNTYRTVSEEFKHAQVAGEAFCSSSHMCVRTAPSPRQTSSPPSSALSPAYSAKSRHADEDAHRAALAARDDEIARLQRSIAATPSSQAYWRLKRKLRIYKVRVFPSSLISSSSPLT